MARISHRHLLNYSVKKAALSEHGYCRGSSKPSATQLNLKSVSLFTVPVSLRLDATVRRADAENWGSLISRNVKKNKENFPACVYIKANVKRVCSLGAHPSSAAPAGLSDGPQHGFMASLQ